MYLIINGNRHTVSQRVATSDTIRFFDVTPEPANISGTIQMFRNDGFLMSEDNVGKFTRKAYSDAVLLLTNKPAPNTDPFTPLPKPPKAKVVTAVVG